MPPLKQQERANKVEDLQLYLMKSENQASLNAGKPCYDNSDRTCQRALLVAMGYGQDRSSVPTAFIRSFISMGFEMKPSITGI